MKYSLLLLILLFIGNTINSFAQQSPQSGQKVVRLNPVKVDTTDPNKKALNKFSKENMYNITVPEKPKTPEEIKAQSFFNSGSKKGKEGDYQGAIYDFTMSLDMKKNPSTYIKRGYAYQMIGNYGAAIQDASEALRLDPGLSKGYFIRGISRYETGDLKGAKDDLFHFLEVDRTNAIAFNYMAAILFLNQDYKGALEHYNEVLRLDPKYPDIYTNRGMMRHYLQDFKGAIQDCNEALKIDPKNITALNNRGAAKMMLKDLQGALVDFNKALEINPKYADAYDNRGRTKQALGDTEGACADWQAAYSNGLEASRNLILKYCK